MPARETDEQPGAQMSLLEHLEELRTALIRILITIGVGFGICWFFHRQLRTFLIRPLIQALPEGSRQLIFTKVPEAFFAYLWISFIAGFVVTSPVIFYHIWRFIAPGLYRHERRYALTFVLVSSFLFLTGTAMAYSYVFPFGFTFFMKFGGEYVSPFIRLTDYLRFTSRLLLAFGLVFEMPIIIVFLTRMGVVNPSSLAKKRKYIVLILFTASAILTPPDVITQLMMAGPLLLLFEISLWLARLFERRREKETAPKGSATGG